MQQFGDVNFWALGYSDLGGAKAARADVLRVEDLHGLRVLDAVVVTRPQDGSFTFERDELPTMTSGAIGLGILGLVMGLVVLQPLAGAAIGAAMGSLFAVAVRQIGIDDDFVNEIKELIKPGTSALFLLTRTDNPEAVRHNIRGLGGTVLRTNVDTDLARQVQEALNAPRPTS